MMMGAWNGFITHSRSALLTYLTEAVYGLGNHIMELPPETIKLQLRVINHARKHSAEIGRTSS